jgi:hypothetical protein
MARINSRGAFFLPLKRHSESHQGQPITKYLTKQRAVKQKAELREQLQNRVAADLGSMI